MPDRSFFNWLGHNRVQLVLLALTFIFVWIFIMLGMASGLHQNQGIDKLSGDYVRVIGEAATAREEATKTRKAVERIERRLDTTGEGKW